MKKISILTCLALFAATLTQQGGAWAQEAQDTKPDNWGQVPTTTSAWTHITAGSTTGFELKDAYYYVSENLTFTNTSGGAGQGSGMYVQAGKTVHLYIPAGVTLTAIGADGDGNIGGGAGILLPSTSTLHIIGGGTIIATGGAAANGGAGGAGTDAIYTPEADDNDTKTWIFGAKITAGRGGAGGNGGGGAGAGIGTAGGDGGAGAPAPTTSFESYVDWEGGDGPGVAGTNGSTGTSAVATMGTLYIQSTIIQQITGGSKGAGGSKGTIGKGSFTGGDIEFTGIDFVNIGGVPIPIPNFDVTDLQAVAGGGGGGGGAGGGSAQAIGSGGAGGGGGGSGASGSACAHNGWVNDNWGSVGAGGGIGGVGLEENSGTDGGSYWFVGDDNIFDTAGNIKHGGSGGAAGAASVAGSNAATEQYTAPQYTVSYYTFGVTPTKTSDNYNVGSSTKITLPSLSGGNNNYKWILSIHGRAAGNTTSHCAAPNGDVYEPLAEVDLSNIYGAIEFCAVYVGCDIDCTDHTNNYWSTAWSSYIAGKYAVVKLTNRKLYKDGYWNTLTLPFSLDAAKLANTCLAGADIRTFKSTEWDNDTKRLVINFSDTNDGKITAGVPCIIRWGTPNDAPGGIIENPIFTNVTVSITDQTDFYDGIDEQTGLSNQYEKQSEHGLRFQAQIAPVQVESGNGTLLLGANNKLYIPNNEVWVNATHAYFTYENGDIQAPHMIVMDFGGGDQETTYIEGITVNNAPERTIEGIFNLSGQRLDAPRKGINIINGKKVVIK